MAAAVVVSVTLGALPLLLFLNLDLTGLKPLNLAGAEVTFKNYYTFGFS